MKDVLPSFYPTFYPTFYMGFAWTARDKAISIFSITSYKIRYKWRFKVV